MESKLKLWNISFYHTVIITTVCTVYVHSEIHENNVTDINFQYNISHVYLD